MPAHSFLIETHFDEARSKPTILQVPVKMRRAVRGMEQQTSVSGCITLQVLCNGRVQVNLPFGCGGLEVFHDNRCILLNLLLDSNRATVVREMTSFHRKRLRNSHASGCEQ